MDKLLPLGVLTYDFKDYQYKEYLYVDSLTGNVYRSFLPEEDEDFVNVNSTDLVTDKRGFFEETIIPKRMIELPSKPKKTTYHAIMFSKELNIPLQCFVMEEEYEGIKHKMVYYDTKINMEAKFINE
ncbi:hypothetical protein [Staphylococcus phage PMBT8]|nr:hypothetical protein [Staphylococcus phage PMBT8]